MSEVKLQQGSDDWKKWRKWCTESEPGKYSALYFLVSKVLGLEDKIPMTPSAHYAFCLFAERATGIPEIDDAQVQLIQVARGYGKALALDTPIPTPSGWTTMGDLKPGDEVYAEDGSATEVVWTSPTYLNNTCYRVEFDSGDEIVADAEHLWGVQDKNSINREYGSRIVVTTEELKKGLRRGNRSDLNFFIPLASPIAGRRSSIQIDPYVLGLWLGDGTSGNAVITVSEKDIDEVTDLIESCGYSASRRDWESSASPSLLVQAIDEDGRVLNGRTAGNLQTLLREVGVLNNKHIPDEYFRAGRDARLALLQGLMDSDGYINDVNYAEFTSTNKSLADGVYELLASLGMKPRMKTKTATLYGKDCGIAYRVFVRPTEQIFRLRRKAEKITFGGSQARRHTHRTITAVEEIDSVPVRCIAVEHPSKQFLVGRGFISTHNSGIVTTGRSIQRLLQDPDWTIGIGNETQNMASRFLGAIKQQFEQNTLLQSLFPEVIPDPRSTTWRDDEIIINRPSSNPAPSVMAIGVGGTRTGIHLDEWIIDDLISKDAAENARKGLFTEVESANDWIVQLPALLNSPERDPITVIGTPWYAGDSYEFIEKYFGNTDDLKEEPDFRTVWTLNLPTGETQHIPLYRRGDLAVFKRPAIVNGKSIFPERWTTEELEKMSVRPKTAQWFQANYMLNPTGGMATTFEMDWIQSFEWEANGHQIRYRDQQGKTQFVRVKDLATFISVDPAFSDRQSSARTAIPVIGTNGTEMFLLEDFAEHGVNVDEIAHRVVDFYMRYKPRKVFVETIVAQIAVADAIRRVAKEEGVGHIQIEEIRSHGKQKKDWRILSLEPYFKRRMFYTHRSHHNFVEEYSNFPLGKLRDVLDAISFQREEWERMFTVAGGGVGYDQSPERIRQAEAQARARIRKAWGRRRRR